MRSVLGHLLANTGGQPVMLVLVNLRGDALLGIGQVSQSTATRFGNLLARHGTEPSMSRRGNGYDNAQAKSFWSRLNTELLDGGSFPSLEETRLELSHYIAYYNGERHHSALGYQSPNHFETHLQTTSQ